MAITITFTLDEETVKRLGELAQNGKKSETIRKLISQEWERLFVDGETVYAPVEPAPAEVITG